MRRLVQKLGLLKSILLITSFSVLISNVITLSVMQIMGSLDTLSIGLTIATIVPLFVAPISSWPILSLLIKIDSLEKDMRKLATYDSLTGLLSRQSFFHEANQAIKLAKREGTELSVIGLDLDNFKAINDKFGHAAGDVVLKNFAESTQANVKENHLFGRIGGEEFALVLPKTNEQDALLFAEKLHGIVRESTIIFDQNTIKYTMSIGLVSLLPNEQDTVESILKKADKSLYQAKQMGRNRTEVF